MRQVLFAAKQRQWMNRGLSSHFKAMQSTFFLNPGRGKTTAMDEQRLLSLKVPMEVLG